MIKYFFIGLLFSSLFSCKSISISLIDKGSTPEEWQSFSIKTLENAAPNCPLNLPVQLSESLKDGLQNNTRLELNTETGSGEVYIEGVINEYSVVPVAVQNENTAAQNRLTISVQFDIFISKPKEEKMALRSTRFADFNSNTNLAELENDLIEEINEQIVQDLINKLLSNW